MGDNQHTQNIQIDKVMVERKSVSFVLWKKPYRLCGQPNSSYYLPTACNNTPSQIQGINMKYPEVQRVEGGLSQKDHT